MMNREILFRGKRVDNGEWIEGYLMNENRINASFYDDDACAWIDDPVEVIPKTVGQYTGLTDKNGKKIFEDDILKFTNDEGDSSLYSVQWSDYFAAWVTQRMDEIYDAELMECWSEDWRSYYEIIGNIHDNPELLKG